MSTISRVINDDCLSHGAWKRQGRPIWWIRVVTGDNIEYLQIPSIRGDEMLDVTVNVDPGTWVLTGVGQGSGSIRQGVVTSPATYDASRVAEQVNDLLRGLNKGQIVDAIAIVIRDTLGT